MELTQYKPFFSGSPILETIFFAQVSDCPDAKRRQIFTSAGALATDLVVLKKNMSEASNPTEPFRAIREAPKAGDETVNYCTLREWIVSIMVNCCF
ncbi:MAG: hypothetical protein PHC64_09125 [Candidatus Gastranaerophilales bacterium]|nr:hypothetical protein [Candidatus Gastranaerophilales bacterium]